VGTTWDFTEGANSWQFETYLLLANPNLTTAATATLTFTRTDGVVITSPVTVPAGGRLSVWTKGITGLANTSFRTVVAVTNGVGIVAERATYWPLNTGGGVYSVAGTTGAETPGAAAPQGVLAPLTIPLETGADTDVPAVQTFNPYAPTWTLRTPPRLYQNLLGYPTEQERDVHR
jgi:Mrp family chromosome partitioning ATPase